MKVNFYATLRAIVGQKTLEVALPPEATARDLVNAVVAIYPPLRAELLDANQELAPHMKLLINGREVIYLENKMETRLQPTDQLDLFPPVGGG